MNVRLFLLIATTALFGLLWSSDQQYQETQMAAVRSEGMAIKQWVSHTARLPVAASESAFEIAVPISEPRPAQSSWVAPTFATPASEDQNREPVVAPNIVRSETLPTIARGPGVARKSIVSAVVLFRRASFRLFEDGQVDNIKPANNVESGSSLEAQRVGFVHWISQIPFEIAGETCWMRWQMRRTAYFAQRRALAIVRRPEFDWLELIRKFARGTLGPIGPAEKNAAAPGADNR
jgi:hypothetical protein